MRGLTVYHFCELETTVKLYSRYKALTILLNLYTRRDLHIIYVYYKLTF